MKNADEIVIDLGLLTLTLFFLYIVYSVARILLPIDLLDIFVSILQLVFGVVVLVVVLVALVIGVFWISEGGFDEGITTLARRLHRLK